MSSLIRDTIDQLCFPHFQVMLGAIPLLLLDDPLAKS